MTGPNAEGRYPDITGRQFLFEDVLNGRMSTGAIAGLLSMLADHGESYADIAGAVLAMRETMLPIKAPRDAIDVCGTGGDGSHSLNVSTAVAIVVASCGVPVAKHGNRAASSKAGGADTLEALGVNLNTDIDANEKCLADLGIAFLFAQKHHPKLASLAQLRRAMARPTIFNLIGPLCNPAGVTRQLIGVARPDPFQRIIEVVRTLDRLNNPTPSRVMIVNGGNADEGYIDEIATYGNTRVATIGLPEWVGDQVTPEMAGIGVHPLDALRGGDAAHNAAQLRKLLRGDPDQNVAYRDAVLINAAAALIVADHVSSWREGVEEAAEAIDKGLANTLLDCWIAYK